MIKLIFRDFRRFRKEESFSAVRTLLFTQGFAAVWVYRFAHAVCFQCHILFVRQILLGIAFFLEKTIEITTGICLPAHCQVGSGLFISHFGGIMVNSGTKIGDNCNLSHGVTIGIKHGGNHAGVPRIGNRVYVGPNAVIIGGIEIGDDAAVGAGAIVTKSVPPRAVVAGNPARIISYNGSFDYIHYDGMENDPQRTLALALSEAA